MSNHLAVATVTATLVHVLQEPVTATVNGASVYAGTPVAENGAQTSPGVSVFLYRVQPNAAWRNEDLPTRGSDGTVVGRPQVALDLDYLLTFYGADRELEPQLLLGTVVRELHTRPVLSREAIGAVALADSSVASSDLADQPELVRFVPLALDLEELSKLWSVFFQTTYRLSVAYRASVVLISPDEPARQALPVRETRLLATTIRRPRIERVVSASGPRAPVTVGDVVRVVGSQLRGEVTAVWLGSERVDPPQEAVGEGEIRVAVPATVRAGLVGVLVEHRRLLGEPASERPAASSNVAPLVVHPRVRQVDGEFLVKVVPHAVAGHALEVRLEPPVGRRQRVVVYLNRLGAAAGDVPSGYSFPAASRDVEGAPDETDTVEVPVPGVAPGTYLVRVQVDGAESPLVSDGDATSPTYERYVAPKVDVP